MERTSRKPYKLRQLWPYTYPVRSWTSFSWPLDERMGPGNSALKDSQSGGLGLQTTSPRTKSRKRTQSATFVPTNAELRDTTVLRMPPVAIERGRKHSGSLGATLMSRAPAVRCCPWQAAFGSTLAGCRTAPRRHGPSGGIPPKLWKVSRPQSLWISLPRTAAVENYTSQQGHSTRKPANPHQSSFKQGPGTRSDWWWSCFGSCPPL